MNTKASDAAALRLELARVLQSRVFERAQRSQRFLRYLVEAALSDPPLAVKELTAAIEVFDRDVTYNPSVDATVRVEASRLRSRLREYYAESGRDDPWMIEIPKGSYAVVFKRRGPSELPVEFVTRYAHSARIGGGLAVALLLLLMFFLTRHKWRPERAYETLQVRRVTPITTDEGIAADPAISPDGTQLAYSWNGEDGIAHIYWKSFTGQQRLCLSHGQNSDRYPVWSPDGSQIAFMRFLPQDQMEILTVSAAGGNETVLRKVKLGIGVFQPSGRLLAWTADHRWLCFTDRAPRGVFQLFLLSSATGSVKPLHSQAVDSNESSPAFSPDGRSVAFVRFYGVVTTELMIQRLADSQQTEGRPIVVSNTTNPSSPIWLRDGRLVFLDGGNLMQASIGSPIASQVYASNLSLQGLAHDSAHARLITSSRLPGGGIFSVSLKGSVAAGDPKPFIRSSAVEESPAFSPDGKWLVFISGRSGAAELWLADSNGRNPRQLTQLSAQLVGFPMVC